MTDLAIYLMAPSLVLLLLCVGPIVRSRRRFRQFVDQWGEDIARLLTSRQIGSSPTILKRELTIVYIDLTVATDLSEQPTPDDLERSFQVMADIFGLIASKHAGVMEQQIGDGAKLVFGLRNAGRNHAADALNAVQDAMALLRRSPGLTSIRPSLAAGIATGEVGISVIGAPTQMVLGVRGYADYVAARLLNAAGRQKVPLLMDERTMANVRSEVQTFSLGPQQLEDLPTPVMAFGLVAVDEIQSVLKV